MAEDDAATVAEDNPVTIPVLDNDSDVDGDPLTIDEVTQPANGTVVINPDGTVTYTPDPDFNGIDTFTYTVCDPSGACDTATVTVNVTPVNDAPVALPDTNTVTEDQSPNPVTGDVLLNDSDVDGDPLVVSEVNGSAANVDAAIDGLYGTLVLNSDGSYSYTLDNTNPVVDALDDGEFLVDSFTYTNSDGELSDSSTLTIRIDGTNDAPVAVDDLYATDEDTLLSIMAAGILGNDSDVDGDALTVVSVDDSGTAGLVTWNPDGSFSYDPNGQFEGLAVGETATDSFAYTISDGNGGSDTATVTITIVGVNDAPTAVDDAGTTDEDTVLTVAGPGILTNDTDPDASDVLAVSEVNGDAAAVGQQITLASGALLTVNSDGSYGYDPNGQFEGLAVGETATDSFAYTISDGNGGSDTATVTITIVGVNDAPTAVDDSYRTSQGVALTVPASGVLGNDSDPDASDVLVVDSYDATSQFGGTVVMNPDGSFSYTPADRFAGVDTFTYTISDGNGGFDTATVTITVDAKNQRSIQVEYVDFDFVGPLQEGRLRGSFFITNQSEGPFDVQITSMDIVVEYRRPGSGKWTQVDTIDTFSQPAPLVFSDSVTIGFDSQLDPADSIPSGSVVRVTAVVTIFGRTKEFLVRSTKIVS